MIALIQSSAFKASPFTKVLYLAFAVALFCNVHVDTVNAADDTTRRLRTSVARMNHWLGSGAKARTWRKFLNLNVLDSQAAKGEQANPETLRNILARFEQDHDSLDHSVFREVSSAIEAQIKQIETTRTPQFSDIQSATSQAIGSFQKPTKAQLEYDRDIARYELEVLKKTYRRDYGSRMRAEVFHKLKLDSAIDFLSDLKIEFPPEVSIGKMNSMIRDERKRLEEVQDKIDALPFESPKEDSDEEEPEDLDIELSPLELSPPGPDVDDEDDRKSLLAKKEAITKRIGELRKKGSEILTKDRPRLLRRRDAGRELRRISQRFRLLSKKRMDPSFAAARVAIDRFADSFQYATEDNIQQEYLEEVEQLNKLIPSLDDPNARYSHAKIANILHWLESRQQLSDLGVAIRRRYSNPNAYASVSSKIIQGLTTQTSSEYERVAEDFLGRFARGLQYTTTTVNVVPVDNPDQVHVSILLNGTASADTYVRERSFRINSTATGHLSARRDLFANLSGLFATSASANANMSTQFGGINSSCGLVQRFARKSFDKEQARSNAESSRRAKERLESRFVSETSSVIDGAIEQVESLASEAREYSAFLPQVFFRSFSQRIEAVVKKDTRHAFAAPNHPTYQVAGSDVQLKIHESLPSNYLDPIFAGKEFTQAELLEELKSYTGDLDFEIPEPDEDAEPVEEFTVRFAEIRPIQIEFTDNRLGITITGTRFEQGERAITTSVAIKLKFKIVNRDGKLFIKPDGTPEIDLAEGEEPGAESIAFAKILEEQLADLVKESGQEGFELPPNLIPSIPQLKDVSLLQSLQLGLLETRDGWLYVGWNWQGGTLNTPAIWNEVVVNEFDPLYLPDLAPPPEDESVLIVEPLPELSAPTAPVSTNGVLNHVETGLGR